AKAPAAAAPVKEEPKKAAKSAKAKPAEPAKAEKPAEDDKTAILRETFDAKLREIRYLNDLIDDEAVSARIDDIESITANIFYLVQEKPERMEEIRTFMNYYLPTTFKLLNAYARLEKQRVAGENVTHSKREIEAILDKLVEGFRQQLDRLFQSDAIDISSDIDVLETMMAKDGLLNDGLKPRT
ncbi:MAG: 5-bromo-4-chloroindolyl phosphate hydrolysis family protein, partial [Clostridia bacterium]|nr:5-bromo-4-chloroindolyl phosphate hydrolysis family protein [Clostridia bacterium]